MRRWELYGDWALMRHLKLLRVILVSIFLFGLYTNLSISFGELRLYGAYSLFAGVVLLALRPPNSRKWLHSVALLTGICSLSVIFGAQLWGQGLRSSAQLLLSVIACTGFVRELSRYSREQLTRLFFYSAVVVIAFAFLEAFVGLSAFSDAVRARLYGEDGVFLYSSDDRDILLHGITRPKVFTQEPSHPAKWVAVMLSAWLLLSSSKRKEIIFVGLLIVAMAAMRSPTLLLSLIAFFYFSFINQAKTSLGWRLIRGFSLAVLLFALATVQYWAAVLPFERAQALADGSDASSVIRLIGPAQIAIEQLQKDPFFGVGIGATSAADDTLRSVYSQYESIKMERFDLVQDSGWGNSLFQFFVFFGILGSGLFFFWLVRYGRLFFGIKAAATLVLFVAIFNFEGAFVIIRPWAYLFLLMLAVRFSVAAVNNRV